MVDEDSRQGLCRCGGLDSAAPGASGRGNSDGRRGYLLIWALAPVVPTLRPDANLAEAVRILPGNSGLLPGTDLWHILVTLPLLRHSLLG